MLLTNWDQSRFLLLYFIPTVFVQLDKLTCVFFMHLCICLGYTWCACIFRTRVSCMRVFLAESCWCMQECSDTSVTWYAGWYICSLSACWSDDCVGFETAARFISASEHRLQHAIEPQWAHRSESRLLFWSLVWRCAYFSFCRWFTRKFTESLPLVWRKVLTPSISWSVTW